MEHEFKVWGVANSDSMPPAARKAFDDANERYRAELGPRSGGFAQASVARLEASVSVGAERRWQGKAFCELSPMERHRLKAADATGYADMRADNLRQIAAVRTRLSAAKTREEYQRGRAELLRLEGITEGPTAA